ncbi:MAG: hypothetical protein JSV92_00430 [archaeon]|nr:MAG: hypothetical protein JSV92_00430 [archaeon]
MNLKELAKFLVEAKKKTYAAEGKEIEPERKGFKELEYKKGKWYYRDSYTGFFLAPGQELVRYDGKPVWSMSYSGGMKEEFHDDIEFAKETFAFLKKALAGVEESRPFRGPERLEEGEFLYVDESEGDIKQFKGTEKIFYNDKEVFSQNYIGGLIKGK